jgi:hypothetical protein
MKDKKMILSIALVLGLGLTTMQAQTMYVRLQSGTQTGYVLSDIQKITFSGGQMHVRQTSSGTTNYTLSELRYVNFSDLTTEIKPAETTSEKLFLYPNPVVNELNIGLPQVSSEQITIEIYSFEGKKLFCHDINQSGGVYSINVEFLNKGVYIIKFQTNNQVSTAKFVKN